MVWGSRPPPPPPPPPNPLEKFICRRLNKKYVQHFASRNAHSYVHSYRERSKDTFPISIRSWLWARTMHSHLCPLWPFEMDFLCFGGQFFVCLSGVCVIKKFHLMSECPLQPRVGTGLFSWIPLFAQFSLLPRASVELKSFQICSRGEQKRSVSRPP